MCETPAVTDPEIRELAWQLAAATWIQQLPWDVQCGLNLPFAQWTPLERETRNLPNPAPYPKFPLTTGQRDRWQALSDHVDQLFDQDMRAVARWIDAFGSPDDVPEFFRVGVYESIDASAPGGTDPNVWLDTLDRWIASRIG